MAAAKKVIDFIPAKPEDTRSLRLLAWKSEAHWGYKKEFMEVFDHKFNITEQFILENPVYVCREGGSPAAFWGLRRSADQWELEYFYVAEQELGRGYGKQMWNHMTGWCKAQDILTIHFVTSPQATGFYEKMGAVQDGESKSIVDNRPVPYFVYNINSSQIFR